MISGSCFQKVPALQKCLCTAPVFRSKPEIDGGYLHGGFWKYNTKPSNILPSSDEEVDDESEAGCTIQDDVIVAGQDVAAGFIRMGILPRICYLLEASIYLDFISLHFMSKKFIVCVHCLQPLRASFLIYDIIVCFLKAPLKN